MDSIISNGKKRGRKIILMILVVLAVVGCTALILIIAMKGDGGKNDEGDTQKIPDEMIEQYRTISEQAEEAMLLMKELEEEQAIDDCAEYCSDLEECLLAMEELYDDVDAAVKEMDEAADDMLQEYQEYEQLYEEIAGYYSYLEGVCQQAMEILEYLGTTSTMLEDLEQVSELAQRISRIPVASQGSDAVQIIMEKVSSISENTQQATPPPGTLSGFSSSLEQLPAKAQEISRMLKEALSAGDIQAMRSYASQLSAEVQSLQGQLQGGISAFVESTLNQLEELASALSGAIP